MRSLVKVKAARSGSAAFRMASSWASGSTFSPGPRGSRASGLVSSTVSPAAAAAPATAAATFPSISVTMLGRGVEDGGGFFPLWPASACGTAVSVSCHPAGSSEGATASRTALLTATAARTCAGTFASAVGCGCSVESCLATPAVRLAVPVMAASGAVGSVSSQLFKTCRSTTSAALRSGGAAAAALAPLLEAMRVSRNRPEREKACFTSSAVTGAAVEV
jgi:hypothetical protein